MKAKKKNWADLPEAFRIATDYFMRVVLIFLILPTAFEV